MSSDGSAILAGVYNGRLYLSTNSGTSWSEVQPAGAANKYWQTISTRRVTYCGVNTTKVYLGIEGLLPKPSAAGSYCLLATPTTVTHYTLGWWLSTFSLAVLALRRRMELGHMQVNRGKPYYTKGESILSWNQRLIWSIRLLFATRFTGDKWQLPIPSYKTTRSHRCSLTRRTTRSLEAGHTTNGQMHEQYNYARL